MNKRGLTATLLLAGLLLAGCGADNESQSDSGSAGAPAVGEADRKVDQAGGGAAQEQAAPTQGKDSAAQAPDLRVDQRSIIYTGSITLRVEDVTSAAAQVTGIAAASGGFVGGDERHSGDGSSTANITLRVPADKFTSAVDQIAKLGTEETRGINTEDVTEQVVDLDARISVQKARVESGKRLLAEAKSLDDLVMLEREVATRESDLAALEGKKRRLSDLTSLSTITVVLLDPAAAAVEPEEEPPGFLAGLAGGWKALMASLGVLLTILGALLPWIIAIGLPAWAVMHLLRRYRRRNTPALVAPPAETPASNP
ncbi:lipoprotein [Actinoplanes lobatus]|uniref:Lipoprotein n=1 Tax=Actinoplanes lobatus TaxID=113568 RepID=A0A7W7MET6_9ACTN|nr:DUF4349 domain-containing protein [Actinoplanes lobatus]MBB4747180.1 hypothetical protein [Actinoplanes lobatus]GGN56081.1 lipoprotein [Actinoplanes lobatus]GIE39253.1 lipoprotein [Actinoplanes lobatus]